MHSRVSGLSDYFAADEQDAIRIGRDIMARINWRKLGPPPGDGNPAGPRYDPDEILGIVPAGCEGAVRTRAKCWPVPWTGPNSTSTSRCTAPRW